MSKIEEVTLTVRRERVRFDSRDAEAPGTAIVECLDESAAENKPPAGSLSAFLPEAHGQRVVKVDCFEDDLVPGLSYRFYGRWTEHPKYGPQFQARTFVGTEPHSRSGVIRYLSHAPHVGKATATALWDRFGSDAVRVLRTQPEVAVAAIDASHFTETKAQEASRHLQQQADTEAVTIELTDLLEGRGFPKAIQRSILREWGNRGVRLVRKNPFLLMRFPRCGFVRCDQLYLDGGGNPRRLKRQAFCAWYSITRNTHGHTWFAPAVIEHGLREFVAGADIQPVAAVKLARRAKLLATTRDADGAIWIAEARDALHETRVVERVRRWLAEPSQWPSPGTLDVSDHQRETLEHALGAPLGIFTGGGGTGKSYSAARLIDALVRRHGDGETAVVAPTGKAACRVSELLAEYGVPVRARTIHSLLGVASHSEGLGWAFEHHAGNPLPYRFLIVDEASMLDTSLAASLFDACGPGTHVLLIGDTGQLPPVGHGAPLRDLISAGVPCGELTEIRRNSGQIVHACADIRQGRKFRTSARLNPDTGENLRLKPAANGPAALETVVRSLKQVRNRNLAHPLWDCQVIVAVNLKSPLSRHAVNRRLQDELNPGGARAPGSPFRVGDKVICLRNGLVPIAEPAPPGYNEDVMLGERVFCANGEQGAVVAVAPQLTTIKLDSPLRLVNVPRGASRETDEAEANTGCDWDLAYAISCHKAQGAQWPIVFVLLDEYPGARMVCSREWLYTGLSRAEQVCFLVGKLETAHAMLGQEGIRRRKTFLTERIHDESQTIQVGSRDIRSMDEWPR